MKYIMIEYTNGTAKLVDIEGYLEWYGKLSADEFRTILRRLLNATVDKSSLQSPERTAINDLFFTSEFHHEDLQKKGISRIRTFISYAQSTNMPFRVKTWVPGIFAYLYLGNPRKGIIVADPEKYLEYIPERDYSDLTLAQVRAEIQSTGDAGMSLIPKQFEKMTPGTARAKLDAKRAEADQLKQKMQDVQDAKEESLAKLRAEIEAKQKELQEKQDALMQELEQKKSAMEEMIDQMEDQIFLLESQIYAIRCYSGEVVNFTQISSGKKAPDDEPVVIHQKLRFLDEDLGRLASLYEISWNNLSLFEDFLRYSPAALEAFAPNERCVVLIRLSRNDKVFLESSRFPYSNMLESYNYFHGKTVGIIIRNGENLYLGWTDEEKVHIADDFIVTQVFTETIPVQQDDPDNPLSSYERKQLNEKRKKERMEKRELMDGIVSRVFIYNILQGIVDSSDLLPLPEGVKLNIQSQYVVYSVADRWLSDTRFGSFTEIIEQCNSKVSKGDSLLIIQRLVPERVYGTYLTTWQNVRGRGDANRTHDCVVSDCTIYPVNLIEKTEDGRPHIFISVEKQDSGYLTEKKARANFELCSSEFINLTYMNSVWLEWVINNKTLGDWRVGGERVDYAFAIRYLKTAMEYIRRREAGEKQCLDDIDPSICKDPDWPLKLTQWKMETGVRSINPYQAARFAKSLK